MRKRLERFFYYGLYSLVTFFVYIGDITRLILRSPFAAALFFSKKIKLPQFKIPAFKLPQIKSPSFKIRLPKKVKKRKATLLLVYKVRYFILGALIAILLSFASQTYQFAKSLPSPKSIGKVNYPLSTHMYDRNGKLLYEVYREQNRTPVKLDELPSYVAQASIAFEDKDFFHHNGVSLFGGIVRAVKETLITKKVQGGSTITQQLVKSSLLTPERTIERKLKEIILAMWAERIYSKRQILEMYLNQVPYGGSSYGIEEASKTYFKKSAKELNIEEAALLAGLPQAPSLYSPFVNPQLAKTRRDEVLKKMLEQEYISEGVFNNAVKTPLTITTPSTPIKAPHFVFHLKSQLEKQFGIRMIEEGGLHVVSSLDLQIQETIEQILKEELDKIRSLNVTNGAILVTRPTTGEILAMAGSADYFATPSGAFNATIALRQPGSAIKPIMYSLALQNNFVASSVIDDSPVVFAATGAPSYRPVNYDGKFHGRLPLRYALANSYNVPAVKVLNSVGVDNFVDHAKKMGINTWTDNSRFGLSLTLGGGEVQMTDMATAFGVFANLGNKVELSPILTVKDSIGSSLFDLKVAQNKVLDGGISYILSDILSDNVARQQAFGQRSALEIPGYKVAVKTGTTDDKKDNWTIGYTPELLVVVWVGNNDNTSMNPRLTSGITGAAPIWNRVMTHLLTNYSNKNSWFNKPENVIEKPCYGKKIEYFVAGTENNGNCGSLRLTTPTPYKTTQ